LRIVPNFGSSSELLAHETASGGLCDKAVELGVVESVSRDTVRLILKKRTPTAPSQRLVSQCLKRRIGTQAKLETEVKAWVKARNKAKVKIKWQFTVNDARETFNTELS
jgi:hypothetical protein